jgi:hypothetical protein
MSYAILRFEKRKLGGVINMDKHHERKKEAYKSNPDIDKERSNKNYHLKKPTGTYAQMSSERIEKMKCRRRKDSVLLVDTFIGGSPEFISGMNFDEQRKYFNHAYEFIAKNVGEDNILSAVVHMDEKTPHLHLVFTPITEDGRLSAKDVLGNQQKYIEWQDKFHTHMQSKWKDLERGESAKETKRKHLHVYEYKRVTKEIEKLEQRLQEIQSTNVDDISKEDVAVLVNQLNELHEKLQTSESKANADIVEIEMSSDEKMGAVREALVNNKIRFAETVNGFSVPKYAEKLVDDTLKTFKPLKNYGKIRDSIALDIDETIYFSENFEKLLENLQEKGYDIKRGKHLAVRPPNPNKENRRFVRLKSISEYYTEEALKFRIENRDKFQTACRDKIANTTGMEREFNVAVENVIMLFYDKQLRPYKETLSEPYSFKNDYRITRLLNCAKLISADGVTADNIQTKLESLRNRSYEIHKQIKKIEESQKIRADLISCGEEIFTNGADMSAETEKFLKNYGIENQCDIENLREIFIENEQALQNLQSELADNKSKSSIYHRITDMYEDLKYGNYIDKLIHEEQERRVASVKRDEMEDLE